MKKFISLLMVLVFMAGFTACSENAETTTPVTTMEEVTTTATTEEQTTTVLSTVEETDAVNSTETTDYSGMLKVIYFDADKADAMLVETPSHTVMIDTGLKSNSKKLLKKLRKENITNIDVLILTHYDRDHIGGAARIIDNISVGEIYAPDYIASSDEYDALVEASEDNSVEITKLTQKNQTFDFDGADFTIYPPQKTDYGENDDNDFSLVTSLKYGSTSFLFTGDAMEQRLDEIMDIGQFDVLKVPYHGREISNLQEFIDNVKPSYAVVSTDSKDYSDVTDEILTSSGAEVYTTFENKKIIIYSDGENYYTDI